MYVLINTIFSLAPPFQADSATFVLDQAEEAAEMDCKHLNFFETLQVLISVQVIKYTIVYIIMVSILAALIVLRKLDSAQRVDQSLILYLAALFRDRIQFDCAICRNI